MNQKRPDPDALLKRLQAEEAREAARKAEADRKASEKLEKERAKREAEVAKRNAEIARKKAEGTLARIRRGADFGQVASQVSEDPGSKAEKAAALGVPTLDEAAFLQLIGTRPE